MVIQASRFEIGPEDRNFKNPQVERTEQKKLQGREVFIGQTPRNIYQKSSVKQRRRRGGEKGVITAEKRGIEIKRKGQEIQREASDKRRRFPDAELK